VDEPSLISRSPDGLLYCLTLWGCRSPVLAHALNPEVPYVWLWRHLPREQAAWWTAEVPLLPGGEVHELEVRQMEFDAQIPTGRFLKLLPELEESGMVLFQMHRKVPDTLRFRLEDDNMNRILVQNGLFLKFHLPHADEVALLCSPDEEYLATLLRVPAVHRLAH
jgi:hypothetical protein